MLRSPKLYLEDILSSVRKIERFTRHVSRATLSKNAMRYDAILRNLEIIGEAVKQLPSELKQQYPDIEWQKISGLRDILTHAYFGVDARIIWDIVTNKIPALKKVARKMLQEEKFSPDLKL